MMNKITKDLAVTVSANEKIDQVFKKMSKYSKINAHPGLAIISKNQNVIGIVTDGDIRRAYTKGLNFNNKISSIMIKDPILVSNHKSKHEVFIYIQDQIYKKKRIYSSIRHIIFVNKNKIVNIENYKDFFKNFSLDNKITVFGMGYVGLTLSVWLANKNFDIVGIDKNIELTRDLRKAKIHIHEPGLRDMLKINIKQKNLIFSEKLKHQSNIYIIAVGTPVSKSNKPLNNDIIKVVNTICKFLKKDDQIMLRSTLAVGTTRNIIIPFIEKKTNLKAGIDFNISFVPERTVEGDALRELRSLPQIIGGYTNDCTSKSSKFWSSLVSSIVEVGSLEVAELIKLSNNTFRDLSFAFANELAMIADNYNINSFDLINSANKGYGRNYIPQPSPGVGGYCLTKDPIIFSNPITKKKSLVKLGKLSRQINTKAAMYPIRIINRYIKAKKINLKKLDILIIGIAFKGIPETNDFRDSVALKVRDKLISKVNKIYAWDAIIDSQILEKLNFSISNNISKTIKESGAILILNNHPKNIKSELFRSSNDDKLIFDGWYQLNIDEIKKINGITYATMGYNNII